ncbi:MAG TPA: hypothetical protein VFP40_09000 [Terriglobales bacterium]|jgi:hypothetical protein|nr:hypothetical protein [Terriglobales bacterium]
MKYKGRSSIQFAALFLVTALALANDLDHLFHGEPMAYASLRLKAAILGATLFVLSTLVLFAQRRWGLICGLIAGVCCWPYVVALAPKMFGTDLLWTLRFNRDGLAVVTCVLVSSIAAAYGILFRPNRTQSAGNLS